MKGVYEALNNVCMDLSEYEDKPLNDIEVKKINDRIKGKLKHKMVKKLKWTKRVAIIVGTLTLALGVTYKANPTFATNLPLVGDLLRNIIGNGNEEYDKYTQVLNKTIEKNGFRVTLNEFNIDSIGARVAATFETNETLDKDKTFTLNPKIYINGEWINCSGGGSKKVVDDHKYVTIDTLNIAKANKKIPDNMEVKLEYEEIRLGDKVVQGPWIFKFKASKKEVMLETKNYKINKNFDLKDGNNIYIEEVTITPLAMRLKYTSNNGSITLLRAEVLDNNGEGILSTGASASHDSKGTVGENRFNTPKKGIEKLSFKLEVGNMLKKQEYIEQPKFELQID